ncbi:ExbD/TolR family protein [Paraburkholderia caballeronis]|uniref:Outer membrane transport energization protein ExbD n=1 Tax=Paraburkholderia caballeronis TaxID=416943 RepID=A0A1H7TDZ7_9BURK|nr:biopolymer transporter ExbD [Paraburkholderia caballeronis]PXW18324.1 outer membrane transport energization protein ExbD [Paraburkholderia caballeronis]PXW95604.1 outer membrane transport energization protein ExbD [Paraburkholderia caballeronis]RAJ91950.1 outer membrane transport energization protein ExbD [Paraburkholderia caballeronis]TDV02941.1 outer membrane transport energization protein ExbD [Paraburkholderia caballeronis]TDV06883.1 outer membrane transport energization protein ExbD [P
MAFSTDRDDDVMSDINMTPLIDVMLVLLIVFMVTLPVLTHAVKLDLPGASSQPNDTRPAHVTVNIDASGALRWDDQPVARDDVDARLSEAAARQPQPEIQLYADRAVRYDAVADLLSAAQRAGLTKIDFVTQPKTQ